MRSSKNAFIRLGGSAVLDVVNSGGCRPREARAGARM